MAYLDDLWGSLSQYLQKGRYEDVIRGLLYGRSDAQSGNPYGYSGSYMSAAGDDAGLLGTIWQVLTGTDPKVFENRGRSNLDQFQSFFGDYLGKAEQRGQGIGDYRQMALQNMFSNSEGARKYYNQFFGDGVSDSVTGRADAYGNIASQVAALLSNRYSSSALRSMFGGGTLDQMISEFERQRMGNPTGTFFDYLYNQYKDYLPPIQRQTTPTTPTDNPKETNRNPIDKPPPTNRPDDTFPRPKPERQPTEDPYKRRPRKVGGFLGAM